jgi:PAS domain-containing protein
MEVMFPFPLPLAAQSELTNADADFEASKATSPVQQQFLDEIGITELLEEDSRPTFVIDLQATSKFVQGRMNVLFCNKSLRFFDDLRNVVLAETFYPSNLSPTLLQDTQATADTEFREWSTSVPDFDSSTDGYLPRHTFRGMFWTSCTLRGRWRVISASQVFNQSRQSHGTPRSSRSNSRSTSDSRSVVKESLSPVSGASTEVPVFDESELEKQLADSESKFKVLTELNPVGMYYLSPDGNIIYCNDMCKNLIPQ